MWTWKYVRNTVRESAAVAARIHFNQDLVFRRWNAGHGGVYVPITETTPPNPNLSHIPERDIVTPSGRRLTLINPAYMTRQVHDMRAQTQGVRGHITSLNPLRKSNEPDAWEIDALKSFERGESEYSSFVHFQDQTYLRLMRPMLMEKPCVKCHGQQGFKIGDIRGGVSISIPMVPYEAIADKYMAIAGTGFGATWILGLLGLCLASSRIRKQMEDREKAQSALRKSEERFRTLVENVPGATYRCSYGKSRTLVFISDEIKAISGYPGSDFIDNRQRSYDSLIHADDVDMVQEAVSNGVKGNGNYHVEYRIIHADGKPRWVLDNGQAICDTKEKLHYLDGVIVDITERKRAEEKRKEIEVQLQRAQKMQAIGQLAGGVAHDFNNLLTAILGNSEALLMIMREEGECPASESIKSGLNEIMSAGEQGATLTRQLLSFSRCDNSTRSGINIATVLKNTEGLLRRLIGEHIELDIDITADNCFVQATPGQIEQIVMNLAINSADAMPKGGKLVIALDDNTPAGPPLVNNGKNIPERCITITVTDTGTGMNSETLEHVFEPFFTTKPRGQGTGLGLSTVFGTVEQLGGYINIESEPETGTTVRCYLPRSYQQDLETTDEEELIKPSAGETILVCEDEQAVRSIMSQTLLAAGYTVIEADSGTKALETARNQPRPVDLLISDIIMPGMCGNEVAERLVEEYENMRVLFISGTISNTLIENTEKLNGVEFMQKPFGPTALLKRVRIVLDNRKVLV